MLKLLENNFIKKLVESFFGRISYMVFMLVFTVLVTRLYGAEIFGEYTYAFTITSILMIFTKAGLDNGILYTSPNNGYKYFSFSLLINAVLSLIVIMLIWILTNNIYLKFMSIFIWMQSIEEIYFSVYRSRGKIKEYYYINAFLAMLLRIIMVILFSIVGYINEYAIFLSVLISYIVVLTVYTISNKKYIKKIYPSKKFIMYSLPLVVASLMGTLMGRIDIVMVGNFLSKDLVGVYQVSVQVTSLIAVLLLIFNTVFAPQIAKHYHAGESIELVTLYRKATKILSLIALISSMFLILFGKSILLVFGEEFVLGYTSVVLISIAQLVNVGVGGVWTMLAMTGAPKFQMYANIGALLLNVILNLLLIPIYGINGAAFASMVAIVFTNSIGYIIVSKRFNVKVFRYF